MKLSKTQALIEEIRNGKMVILIDDADRENEGDLVFAAEVVKPELINFMIKEARGLVCLAMAPELVEKLELAPMVSLERRPQQTAFTVSIDAASGISSGASAADRAKTIWTATCSNAKPDDLVSPGHVFPLKARKRGVLERPGHTEGSVDLVRLAGLRPAAVICEVLNEDGSMSRGEELMKFADKHQLKIGSIADLIAYLNLNEINLNNEINH